MAQKIQVGVLASLREIKNIKMAKKFDLCFRCSVHDDYRKFFHRLVLLVTVKYLNLTVLFLLNSAESFGAVRSVFTLSENFS